jgi:hypothetical protein
MTAGNPTDRDLADEASAPPPGSRAPLVVAGVVIALILVLGIATLLGGDDDGDVALDEGAAPTEEPVDPDAGDPADDPAEDPAAGEEPPAPADEQPADEPTAPEAEPPAQPAEPPADGQAAAGPITAEGPGNLTTDPFNHDGGLLLLTYEQPEGDSLTVRLVDAGGQPVDLLPATTAAAGRRAAGAPAGEYRLDVVASGGWRVSLERGAEPPLEDLPATVGAEQSDVVGFDAPGGPVAITLQQADGGDLAIRVLDLDGEEVAGGNVTSGGSITVELEQGGHLLEVTTAGAWQAEIAPQL